MQKILRTAAEWYIGTYNFTLEEMRTDLRTVLHQRARALESNDLQSIYRAMACAEIVKAAICLTTGQDYPTSFSRQNLKQIKKIREQRPELYTCKKCGQHFPASAMATREDSPDELSPWCLDCNKEITRIKKLRQQHYKTPCGYINRRGEIICLSI